MNDDVWTMILTMIRGWGLGVVPASAGPSEPAPGLRVFRRRLLVKGYGADAGPRHGLRHYVDRPLAVRQGAGGSALGREAHSNGAPRTVDRNRSGLPRREAIRPRKTQRIGSLIQRFLALRNRRIGPRPSCLEERVPRQPAPRLSLRAHHPFGRSFADSCQDGEAANAEPP